MSRFPREGMPSLLLFPLVCLLAVAGPLPSAAQGDLARQRAAAVQAQPQTAIAGKVKRQPTSVLLIPDDDILRGLELSDAQRQTLIGRLKTAPFKVSRPELNFSERQAMRLPSGELFQAMPSFVVPQVLMQQTLPAPGAAASACSEPGVTDVELLALRSVLAAQLRSRGGDEAGFNSGWPPDCTRKQMLYLVKASVLVVAR